MLTLDDAMRLQDAFEAWIHARVGQAIVHHPSPDKFLVEVLEKRYDRRQKRRTT